VVSAKRFFEAGGIVLIGEREEFLCIGHERGVQMIAELS
jgi:hypothetical protein